MVKVHLTPLFLLTILSGVELLRPKVLYVREGEMVVLHCHLEADDSGLFWTIPSGQRMNQTSDTSTSADQSQMSVLIHGQSLVVLQTSMSHHGNYSCSLGNASSQIWFRLTVYTAQSSEYKEKNQYPATCFTQEPCTLYCPAANIPCTNISGISSRGITWSKEGETSLSQSHFPSVQQNDSGVYTCNRSYTYKGQTYYKTFAVVLNVQTNEQLGESMILSPKQNQEFQVDLGSTVVIDCKAVVTSEADEVFWLSGTSFVEKDDSLPVFYNYSWEQGAKDIETTASLIFKKVSEDDLLRNYTCKLQSDHQSSTFVTIVLTPKARDLSVIICIVGIIVVVLVASAVFKFRIDLALFLRDTLGCYGTPPDGKKYDACLMFYKSSSGVELGKADRKWLEGVLEERFGYSLCLLSENFSEDNESVSECIEQSRTLILFPSSSDSHPGSDLLIKIRAALAEKNTCLILIKPETKRASSTESTSEVLQHLSRAGNCVVWKGRSSMEPKSSFWKLLRFHLSAPQHPPRLLPEELALTDHCQHA
ncbi:interleukin-1 receptor accessory protein [Oryzias melastigma]|uniref:interleukin-1 receptor accessory protein n=1 Tax=Oryzias melastigma TaxID=30732 RepID=UPI00168CBE12|nr:interleukin-1 receptor accessory protein [Oryzias melastigma]